MTGLCMDANRDALAHIKSTVKGVRPGGGGWTNGRCPAHDDKRASFGWRVQEDGWIAFRCFAGCKRDDILAALGLKLEDIGPPSSRTVKPSNGQISRRKFPTLEAALAGQRFDRVHEYRDGHGEIVGVVGRTADKQFIPFTRTPGGFACKGLPEPRPLYGLDCLAALAADALVFIVEGESDVDTLRGLNLNATTWPGGARAVGKADWHGLAHVRGPLCICADADEPGGGAADEVAAILAAQGKQARILTFHEFGRGGDVRDLVEARRSAGNTDEQIREELRGMFKDAPTWCKPAALRRQPTPGAATLTRYSDIAPENIEWLWPGRFARRKLNLLVGDPDVGKSLMTIDMAARVSNGAKWPDGSDCPLGSVILMGIEDGRGDTIRPRLEAAGANLDLVYDIEGPKAHIDDLPTVLSLRDGIATIENAINAAGEESGQPCALVVIDPITAFMGSADDSSNSDIRSVLGPLVGMAERTGVCLVGISHMNKDSARGRHVSHSGIDRIQRGRPVGVDGGPRSRRP